MNYKKRYIAMDSQGEWADWDDMYGIMKELKKLPLKQIVDYVSEFWDLRFKQININKWLWDNKTNEMVLYTKQNNELKELFIIKDFTEHDYKQLPKNDNECLSKIIDRLNKDWCRYSTDNKVETKIYCDNWEE